MPSPLLDIRDDVPRFLRVLRTRSSINEPRDALMHRVDEERAAAADLIEEQQHQLRQQDTQIAELRTILQRVTR